PPPQSPPATGASPEAPDLRGPDGDRRRPATGRPDADRGAATRGDRGSRGDRRPATATPGTPRRSAPTWTVDFRGEPVPSRDIISAVRRYLVGGAGSVAVVAACVHLSLTACNEPGEVNFGNPNTLDRKNLPGDG